MINTVILPSIAAGMDLDPGPAPKIFADAIAGMGLDPDAKIFDVSWWQFAERVIDEHGNEVVVLDFDNIDFVAAKADGYVGVILRAGMGRRIDESFQLAADAAKDAGLLVGAYWYLYVDQGLQVQLMVAQMGTIEGGCELGAWLDQERYGNEDATWQQWEVVIHSNTKYLVDYRAEDPGFYTSLWMWQFTGDMDVINGKPAREYRLWVAHWSDVGDPWLPESWDTWEFWQRGSDLRPDWNHAPSNRTDWGVYNGDNEEFYAAYGGWYPDPDPEPDGELAEQIKVNQIQIEKNRTQIEKLHREDWRLADLVGGVRHTRE